MSATLKTRRLPGGPGKQFRALELMRQLIKTWGRDPALRDWANQVIRKVREGDSKQEIRRLAMGIKLRVRYSRDPWKIETVADPLETLKVGYGDCDDLVVLFGAAAQAIGYPVRLVMAGNTGAAWSHIYNEVYLQDQNGRGKWIPVDLARPIGEIFTIRPDLNKIKRYTMQGEYL